MQFTKNYLRLQYYIVFYIMQTILLVTGQTTSSPIEQTNILWSLSPCQSAFWVPSTPSEFNQNWITYQYEGNPLSQAGQCIFTLESDPNTKIEMTIQQVQLFGNPLTTPPPCLELYDVKMDGNIVLLKQECNVFLSFNQFESLPTFTETNLAVISTTIRYGSFQLRARAVPKNFGSPNKVSPLTTVTKLAVKTLPTVVPSGSINNSVSTPGKPGTTNITLDHLTIFQPTPELSESMPSIEIVTPISTNTSTKVLSKTSH